MQFPELEGNNYGKDVMLKMHDDKPYKNKLNEVEDY